MICLRIVVLSLLCSYGLTTLGQSAHKSDVVVTKQGALWEGKIIHDVEDDTVTLLTSDSLVHYFPYKDIRSVKYGSRNGSAPVAAPASDLKSNTRYGQFVERRRTGGIVLTVLGSVFTGTGIILVAANPGNANTYSGRGSAGVVLHNAAAAGVVLDLAGIPMLIVGAVRLARANKVIKSHPEYQINE